MGMGLALILCLVSQHGSMNAVAYGIDTATRERE